LWRDGSHVLYWGFERRFNVIAGLHSCWALLAAAAFFVCLEMYIVL
jgi:hypothetical protein